MWSLLRSQVKISESNKSNLSHPDIAFQHPPTWYHHLVVIKSHLCQSPQTVRLYDKNYSLQKKLILDEINKVLRNQQ